MHSFAAASGPSAPRNSIRRLLATLVAGALVAVTALVVAGANPAGASAGDEAAMFQATNQSRATYGQAALVLDQALAGVSRAWATQLAASGVLSHNPSYVAQITSQVTSAWTLLGENVGVGSTVDSIQAAFMASSGHQANILGDYNRVGIGAVRDGAGTLWVVVNFLNGPPLPALQTGSPIGNFEAASPSGMGAHLQGWSLDPDTAAPTAVHVYSDGVWAGMATANSTRPDVGAAFPSYGSRHGFDFTVALADGTHTLCVYAINAAGFGGNPLLGCRKVSLYTTPVGNFDGTSTAVGGVNVFGWSFDPDLAAPDVVHVYVDGVWGGLTTANTSRPDVAAVFPAYGPAHGYSLFVPLGAGTHTICTYGINIPNTAGTNRLLACRAVSWSGAPRGNLDGATGSRSGVKLTGWAEDVDSVLPVFVHAYVDGVWDGLGIANQFRPDLATALPAWGGSHGYSFTVPANKGTHTVCAYAINLVGGGTNPLLGCRTVTVP